MAKIYLAGEDIRAKLKICSVCNKEITATQAFTLEIAKVINYKHIDCVKK